MYTEKLQLHERDGKWTELNLLPTKQSHSITTRFMNLGCWRVSLYLHVSSSSTSDSLAQCHAFETNNVTDTTLDRSVNSYTAMSQLMADSRVFGHSSLEILIIHIHQATLNYMATYTLCLLTK